MPDKVVGFTPGDAEKILGMLRDSTPKPATPGAVPPMYIRELDACTVTTEITARVTTTLGTGKAQSITRYDSGSDNFTYDDVKNVFSSAVTVGTYCIIARSRTGEHYVIAADC